MTDAAKKQTGNKLEILFYKYEPMVYRYANKLHDYDQLALEKEDIQQELRVKLYTSILGYLKRWKEYRNAQRSTLTSRFYFRRHAHRSRSRRRPVDMYSYLQCCLGNHVNDFVRKVKRTQEVFTRPSPNQHGIDIGTTDPNTSTIDLGVAKVAILNGVDLLQGLTGDALAIWMLHLKGYTHAEIERMIHTRLERGKLDTHWIKSVIAHQRKKLAKYHDQLMQATPELYRVKEYIED